ncbi:hypothetical protein K402DRAFT_145725 [Aulographum hederae CBS 113979]|uniref:Uncharacterized protein n=1 Tax=Aulographum hederae CBS 113979 TaxID=1176131 RepID=A0A6G1GT95_9PEZI|nr:hypothetical protein K402DRAFT_145725 [Aulographum hederae CBS 113979]
MSTESCAQSTAVAIAIAAIKHIAQYSSDEICHDATAKQSCQGIGDPSTHRQHAQPHHRINPRLFCCSSNYQVRKFAVQCFCPLSRERRHEAICTIRPGAGSDRIASRIPSTTVRVTIPLSSREKRGEEQKSWRNIGPQGDDRIAGHSSVLRARVERKGFPPRCRQNDANHKERTAEHDLLRPLPSTTITVSHPGRPRIACLSVNTAAPRSDSGWTG